MPKADSLETLLADHRAAVCEFTEKAGALSAEGWLAPRAEGKWTPAQETRHLILAYEALLRDIVEGKPMRLRGTPWKRRLWRVIGLAHVRWRKRLPTGVMAVREVRPAWESAPSDELLPLLRQRASEFEAAVARMLDEDPSRTFTHPLLGPLSMTHSLEFCAVHVRHHARFLPPVAR